MRLPSWLDLWYGGDNKGYRTTTMAYYTRLTASFPGQPGQVGTRKVKTSLDLNVRLKCTKIRLAAAPPDLLARLAAMGWLLLRGRREGEGVYLEREGGKG